MEGLTGDCGGTFDSSSGELLSPLYPSNYPINNECLYSVRVLGALNITFVVNDLQLESFDGLYYGEGSTFDIDNAAEITSTGETFTVNSDQAWLYFFSDRSGTLRGFNVTYTTGKRP